MAHQQQYAVPGGWGPPPMAGKGHPEPPQQPQQHQPPQQQQQHRGPHDPNSSSSGGYGPPSNSMDRTGHEPPARGPPMDGVPGARGFAGRMPRGGFNNGGYGSPAGPAGVPSGFYERQGSGSSREGRYSRNRTDREGSGVGGGQGGPYSGGSSSYTGQQEQPAAAPQQQQQQPYMPGQQLQAQLPRQGAGSSHMQQQQQPVPQQQQQQQQYGGRQPGGSSTGTAPYAPAAHEQQLRTVGSYGGPPRQGGNRSSSSSGHHHQGPPPAAAGSAADSGSTAATPRSPAVAQAAGALSSAVPGAAVMMAPRPMAIHPGFWMYPGGAAAQWPMAAYHQHYMPYAYGYYPAAFQVCLCVVWT